MRRTKIVCTIGPASENPKILKRIIHFADVLRLNFSHGDHQSHQRNILNIRKISSQLNKPVAILQDLSGPKIRVGEFKNAVVLKSGKIFSFVSAKEIGDENKVYLPHPEIFTAVKAGDNILLDDGLLELKVLETSQKEIKCKVVVGGKLSSHKGVNLPKISLKISALTEKDKNDLKFGIREGVDYVALSFVRSADDIISLKNILKKEKVSIPIIAKIEKHEAIKNLEEILKVTDGVMIARGDLGVEVPIDFVPVLQKMIIRKCHLLGLPVITATQMLNSMIENPRPTRAEVTDVANAILDGTDAVMLSGETATGKYPLEAVEMIDKIAKRTEPTLSHKEILQSLNPEKTKSITDAISHATCELAQDLQAKAIITSTGSGYTARMVSRYRPKADIFAVTSKEETYRRLALIWGVYPLIAENFKNTDEMIKNTDRALLAFKKLKKGDLAVITGGMPVGIAGKTNLIKAHIVGDKDF